MPKGVYKRKKVGRSKGSRNKTPNRIIMAMKKALEDIKSPNPKSKITTWHMVTEPLKSIKDPWTAQYATPTEPPTFLSRLEAATIKYEQAINDAITALKGQ